MGLLKFDFIRINFGTDILNVVLQVPNKFLKIKKAVKVSYHNSLNWLKTKLDYVIDDVLITQLCEARSSCRCNCSVRLAPKNLNLLSKFVNWLSNVSTLVLTSFSLSILKKSFDELISLTKSVERLSKIELFPPVLFFMTCKEKVFQIYNFDQKKKYDDPLRSLTMFRIESILHSLPCCL